MLREALKVLPGQNSGHYGQEEGSHTDLEPDDGDAVDFHMRDMMRRVGTTVDLLEPRERTVIRMRFGLDEEEKTLEEVGKKIGLTRERIRQIESKALEKLRDSMGEEQDE